MSNNSSFMKKLHSSKARGNVQTLPCHRWSVPWTISILNHSFSCLTTAWKLHCPIFNFVSAKLSLPVCLNRSNLPSTSKTESRRSASWKQTTKISWRMLSSTNKRSSILVKSVPARRESTTTLKNLNMMLLSLKMCKVLHPKSFNNLISASSNLDILHRMMTWKLLWETHSPGQD